MLLKISLIQELDPETYSAYGINSDQVLYCPVAACRKTSSSIYFMLGKIPILTKDLDSSSYASVTIYTKAAVAKLFIQLELASKDVDHIEIPCLVEVVDSFPVFAAVAIA